MPRKSPVSDTIVVLVSKDDGAWWGEIEDPEFDTRGAYSTDAKSFIPNVMKMLKYVGLDKKKIEWTPVDEEAKTFLARIQKPKRKPRTKRTSEE